jgi:predicted DNA-binding transcriptional regulator YafY
MYHPTTRVLAVLALLQSHGRMTGSELSRRLEISARTLRRYIIMLQDLGVPIETERGRNGAYLLTSSHQLPPMMFTNEEALALSLGLLAARRLGLAETDRAIASALAKLERVMPVELKDRVRALTETISIGAQTENSIAPDDATLAIMSSAAKSKHRVRMRYQSQEEQKTDREFDPYGIVYLHQKWYVVGYCHLRKGLRSFRLDRVTSMELTDMEFDRPERFDALQHLAEAIATLPRRYSFEALLKTDLKTAQHEIRGALGILEVDPNGTLLTGSVDDLDWLARQFARFSFEFVVRRPKELNQALNRRSQELARLAKSLSS